MAPRRIPGPMFDVDSAFAVDSVFGRGGHVDPRPVGMEGTADELGAKTRSQLDELGLDLLQMALDLVGIVDPTPVSDGLSALLALGRGQWLDAAISGVGMIPYIGDIAKAGKLPRYERTVERALELAERSREAARLLTPGFMKLREALELFPANANAAVDKMRTIVDRFLRREATPRLAKRWPDISRRFQFRGPTFVSRGGKQYELREAEGALGVPGKVRNHRIPKSLQQSVSGGSGDDAGHLIGAQFGAPSDARNLSRQNWRQNQGGGTWHDMEMAWAQKLQAGTGIRVKVKEYTPAGADRPLYREVEWEEIAPGGGVQKFTSPTFLNTHTADASHRLGSRTQQNVPPSVTEPQTNNVLDLKTGRPLE